MNRFVAVLAVLCGLMLLVAAQDSVVAGGKKEGKAKQQHKDGIHKALHELEEAHRALVVVIKQERKEGKKSDAVVDELHKAVKELGDAIKRAHAAANLDRKK